MSIDFYLEMDAQVEEERVRSALAGAGARLTSEGEQGFAGNFPDSAMTFFFDRLEPPRLLRAQWTDGPRFATASQLSFRPRPATYDVAGAELARFVQALADGSPGAFVLSDQYDSILAARGEAGLKMSPPLGPG